MNRGVHLGTDVRARRKELHLRQEDLADLANVSVRWIGALEAGKPGVQLDKLLAVLDVLGLQLRADMRSPKQS